MKSLFCVWSLLVVILFFQLNIALGEITVTSEIGTYSKNLQGQDVFIIEVHGGVKILLLEGALVSDLNPAQLYELEVCMSDQAQEIKLNGQKINAVMAKVLKASPITKMIGKVIRNHEHDIITLVSIDGSKSYFLKGNGVTLLKNNSIYIMNVKPTDVPGTLKMIIGSETRVPVYACGVNSLRLNFFIKEDGSELEANLNVIAFENSLLATGNCTNDNSSIECLFNQLNSQYYGITHFEQPKDDKFELDLKRTTGNIINFKCNKVDPLKIKL